MAFNLKGVEKDQLVISLAALVCSDSGAELSAENFNSVIEASGNKIASYWAPLYSTYIEKAGGVDKFLAGPGAGGGGGAAAPAAAAKGGAPAVAAAVVEKPKEEEVDALEGGLDMFGAAPGGSDY